MFNLLSVCIGLIIIDDREVSDELVTAKPASIAVVWEILVDGLGDGFKDKVASIVALGIVDVLEVVGVDEEDRAPLFLFDKPVEGRDHLFVEEDTVVDASQLIVVIKFA